MARGEAVPTRPWSRGCRFVTARVHRLLPLCSLLCQHLLGPRCLICQTYHNLTVLLSFPGVPKEARAHSDVWSFPFPSWVALAGRIQTVAFPWIYCPALFTRLCRCPHRCDLVCHLPGPELTPPDGRPPGAGRRVAVPAARRVPDGQRQGGPAPLLSDRPTHLREEPAEPRAAEAKGRIRTTGCLDWTGPQRAPRGTCQGSEAQRRMGATGMVDGEQQRKS